MEIQAIIRISSQTFTIKSTKHNTFENLTIAITVRYVCSEKPSTISKADYYVIGRGPDAGVFRPHLEDLRSNKFPSPGQCFQCASRIFFFFLVLSVTEIMLVAGLLLLQRSLGNYDDRDMRQMCWCQNLKRWR